MLQMQNIIVRPKTDRLLNGEMEKIENRRKAFKYDN